MLDFNNGTFFNKETKNQYIETLGTTDTIPAQKYFKKAADFEAKNGKDIALFSDTEWFDFLLENNIITLNKVKIYFDFFARYALYYFSKNKTNEKNHYKDVTNEELVQYTCGIINSEKCIRRDMMLTMVSEIPSPIDQFLVLALYEGIKGNNFSDIFLLKRQDINTETREFHLASGKVVQVSPELMNIALKAERQTIYLAPQSPLLDIKTAEVTLCESEFVFKLRNNATSMNNINVSRIYRKFAMLRNFFENDEFDAPRIINSGYVDGLKRIMDIYQQDNMKKIYGLPETKALTDRYGFNTSDFRRVIDRLKRTNYI